MQNQYAPPRAAVADVIRSGTSGITDTMIEAMRGTKPWVMLIGILLLIGAAFAILGTLATVGVGVMGMASGSPEAGFMLFAVVFYGIFAVVYILLGLYLVKYSSAIGRLLQSASVADMEDALMLQRKFWKLSGIITLIMLVLMVVGMIAAITIPAMMLGMQ